MIPEAVKNAVLAAVKPEISQETVENEALLAIGADDAEVEKQRQKKREYMRAYRQLPEKRHFIKAQQSRFLAKYSDQLRLKRKEWYHKNKHDAHKMRHFKGEPFKKRVLCPHCGQERNLKALKVHIKRIHPEKLVSAEKISPEREKERDGSETISG